MDRATARDRLARHAEDHARLLGFGNRDRSGLSQGDHALGAIGAHPGQEQGHGRYAAQARRRLEQHVDRRPLVVDGRAGPDDEPEFDAARFDDHVEVAGRNVGDAAPQLFRPACLDD